MLVGYDVRIAARFKLKRRTTSVRLPPTAMLSNRSSELSEASRTRIPIQLMALGSVACTVTLSVTSTRLPSESVTDGGIVSLAADSTLTVTLLLVTRRPLESSANPVIVNVPVVATTVSVST